MSAASLPPASAASSEGEIQALRQENNDLRADQEAATAHEAAQDRYQQSQDRFRTVFDNSPLGQKIITPDLTIRQANPAVVLMLGLSSPAELVGHKIMEFAHPDFVQDWEKLQQELWAHKRPYFTLETCLIRPDKSSFWCRVTSVLFPDDEGEEGELGYTTLEDITERKQARAKVDEVKVKAEAQARESGDKAAEGLSKAALLAALGLGLGTAAAAFGGRRAVPHDVAVAGTPVAY